MSDKLILNGVMQDNFGPLLNGVGQGELIINGVTAEPINYYDYWLYGNFADSSRDRISTQDLATVQQANRWDYEGNMFAADTAMRGSYGLLVGGDAYTVLNGKSNDISDAYWTKDSVTISDSDGYIAASGTQSTRIDITALSSDVSNYTSQAKIKAGTSTWAAIDIFFDGAHHVVWFNLSTGAVGTEINSTGVISGPDVDGYYTCVNTSDINSTGASVNAAFRFADGDGDYTVTGDGSAINGLIDTINVTASAYALPPAINTTTGTLSIPHNYADATYGNKFPIGDGSTLGTNLLNATDGVADGTTLATGDLVAANKYLVITTETDTFGAGVVAGDRVTGLTTTLDANNTVQLIASAQGRAVIEWVPKFDHDVDISSTQLPRNIITHNDSATALLYSATDADWGGNASRFRLFDGTTLADVLAVNYQADTPYTITAIYGPHPSFANAPKMQLSVTDGATTWDSAVVDFDGSFDPEDFLSFAWENDYFMEVKSLKWFREGFE